MEREQLTVFDAFAAQGQRVAFIVRAGTVDPGDIRIEFVYIGLGFLRQIGAFACVDGLREARGDFLEPEPKFGYAFIEGFLRRRRRRLATEKRKHG